MSNSEEIYRYLFESGSDPIFFIENDTGRLLKVNDAAVSLYQFTLEELLTMKNSDLSAEPEETRRVTRSTPIVEKNVVHIPLRYHKKKDGTVFPVEINGRFFEWQGKAVHIASIRDISSRKKAEDDLQAALDVNSNLLQEIKHRVRNSFAVILSLISLRSKKASSDESRGLLEEISSRILSISDLYSMLDVTGSKDFIRLDCYCNKVVESMKKLSGKVEIRTDLDNIEIKTKDAATIGLIIVELITNSIKHAFPTGKEGGWNLN